MKWMLTENKINLYANGQSFHLEKNHPLFNKVMGNLKLGRFEKVEKMLNLAKRVITYTNQQFSVVREKVFLRGKLIVDGDSWYGEKGKGEFLRRQKFSHAL